MGHVFCINGFESLFTTVLVNRTVSLLFISLNWSRHLSGSEFGVSVTDWIPSFNVKRMVALQDYKIIKG